MKDRRDARFDQVAWVVEVIHSDGKWVGPSDGNSLFVALSQVYESQDVET